MDFSKATKKVVDCQEITEKEKESIVTKRKRIVTFEFEGKWYKCSPDAAYSNRMKLPDGRIVMASRGWFERLPVAIPDTIILVDMSQENIVFWWDRIEYELPRSMAGVDHIYLPNGKKLSVGQWEFPEEGAPIPKLIVDTNMGITFAIPVAS